MFSKTLSARLRAAASGPVKDLMIEAADALDGVPAPAPEPVPEHKNHGKVNTTKSLR